MSEHDEDEAAPTLDAGLLKALLGEEAPPPEPEPLSPQIAQVVNDVLDALLKDEIVELDADLRPNLVAELGTVVGEARSPKDFVKRFVRTIVHSDHVEEIYGTDDQLADYVRRAMD